MRVVRVKSGRGRSESKDLIIHIRSKMMSRRKGPSDIGPDLLFHLLSREDRVAGIEM